MKETYNYKAGQKIIILSMDCQKHYNGRVGVITEADNNMLWGTWGTMAVLLDKDVIEIIE